VAVLLVSIFVVPGALVPELALVALGVAWLERRLGVARTVVIGLLGHVLATVVTEYGADVLVRLRLLAQAPADRTDVGVSYVMYAVLAAAVGQLPRRWRPAATAGLAVVVLVPLVAAPGLTSTGHLLAAAVGLAAGSISTQRDKNLTLS
jgi:hypothetical protein